MIKCCPGCYSTWAGGQTCEDCGTALCDPFAPDAAERLPEDVYKYIRLQYGARRGMIVRVLAILLGGTSGFLLLRPAMHLESVARWPAMALALATGVAVWAGIHWLAGKAVRVWVLRKDQVSRRKLARALIKRALR